MPHSDTHEIGYRLRLLRGDKSLALFAQEMGTQAKTIQRYERERMPAAELLVALSVRGANTNWVLTGEGNPYLANEQGQKWLADLRLDQTVAYNPTWVSRVLRSRLEALEVAPEDITEGLEGAGVQWEEFLSLLEGEEGHRVEMRVFWGVVHILGLQLEDLLVELPGAPPPEERPAPEMVDVGGGARVPAYMAEYFKRAMSTPDGRDEIGRLLRKYATGSDAWRRAFEALLELQDQGQEPEAQSSKRKQAG